MQLPRGIRRLGREVAPFDRSHFKKYATIPAGEGFRRADWPWLKNLFAGDREIKLEIQVVPMARVGREELAFEPAEMKTFSPSSKKQAIQQAFDWVRSAKHEAVYVAASAADGTHRPVVVYEFGTFVAE